MPTTSSALKPEATKPATPPGKQYGVHCIAVAYWKKHFEANEGIKDWLRGSRCNDQAEAAMDDPSAEQGDVGPSVTISSMTVESTRVTISLATK